jgi:hypothetical protein
MFLLLLLLLLLLLPDFLCLVVLLLLPGFGGAVCQSCCRCRPPWQLPFQNVVTSAATRDVASQALCRTCLLASGGTRLPSSSSCRWVGVSIDSPATALVSDYQTSWRLATHHT